MLFSNKHHPSQNGHSNLTARNATLNHKARYLGIIIIFLTAMTITIIVLNSIQSPKESFSFETILDVSEYIKDLDSSWQVSSNNPSLSEAKIEPNHGFNTNSLIIYFHSPGSNHITLSKGDHKYTFNVTISADKTMSIFLE